VRTLRLFIATTILLIVAVSGLLFPARNAYALEHMPTRHIEEQFTLPGDPRTFSRHVFIPVEDERFASPESRELLAILAGEIGDDAREKGYLEGPSGVAYRRELEYLAKGYWPLAYITEVGSWHVLMHLAYAIRWEDVPLPWEQRFLGDDDGILPEKIKSSFKPGIGSHSFPKFQHYTELNSPHNREILLLLSLLRWELVGERVEFKFLVGREPSLIFLRELLHATSEYGLHKYSGRKPDENATKELEKAIGTFPHTPYIRGIARTLHSPHSQVMEDFFYQFLTDPSLQPFVATSGVYGHISDEPLGSLQESPRFRYLERRLNLPPSLYSFIEGYGVGRVGIRTDIPAVTTAYFEDHVLTSLDRCASLQCRLATYLDRDKWVPGSLTCALHLSLIERKLREFHQARGGP